MTFLMYDITKSKLQHLSGPLWIKRDDLIDPIIGGNKFRKLKYNLLEAKKQQKSQLLTFGGAYSNHILATARAGQLSDLETIGIIRGHAENGLSRVLKAVQEMGMTLHFVDRDVYKLRNDRCYIDDLQQQYPGAYIVPEGGTNGLALKGVAEIKDELPGDVDVIATASGSGGTLAGLVKAYRDNPNVTILGLSVLKGEDQLTNEVGKLLQEGAVAPRCKWQIITGYHFGGYAKTNNVLLNDIREFQNTYNIPLDYVYTGKMMFGLKEWIANNPNIKKVVAIHTGGVYTAPV